MYNFPHQLNELPKLRAALQVFRTLEQRGQDLNDDGIVGLAMARAHVYAFRAKNLSLAENLRRESRKPRSSQGTRTFARDLRRFFVLLRFLREEIGGALQITPLAAHLLSLEANADEAHSVWRSALRNVTLTSLAGDAAHPYANLLRLVSSRPGIESPRLALALEARDDSDGELERILSLADLPDWSEVLERIDASAAHAANATKILPGLARQLGELRTTGARNYLGDRHDAPAAVEQSATGGRGSLRPPGAPSSRASHPATTGKGVNRRVTSQTIATSPRVENRPGDEVEYADPAQTAEVRRERLERHQAMVRALAPLLEDAGYALYEDPYDTLAVRAGAPTLLVEAKSLDGSLTDEIAQVRAALAQLLYYEALAVPADDRERGLMRVALFEHGISDDHRVFLESHGVCVVWYNAAGQLCARPWSSGRLPAADLGLESICEG